MGVDTRRPPLPAPTEDPSSMDNESALGTDLATNVSRRTDRTSYSIPEDGSPITITKLHTPKDGRLQHGRQKSQTSLLIEYFEASKTGDKTRSKPSVRVKVTPSAARRSKHASDTVQITGIGKDRKPSYTRRISLGNKTDSTLPIEGTEVSRSSESNVSARPPIEVEVLNLNGSDVSRTSRDLRYIDNPSDISSMPPDSILETGAGNHSADTGGATIATLHRTRSRSLERPTETTTTEYLEAPGNDRSRSLSRERITQKVMEKLAARPIEGGSRKNHTREGIEYEPDTKPAKERRRRSSRTQNSEDLISPESSQLSSGITQSQTSYRSGTSKVSLNNPRLLEMVEDTVRRLILPEIEQMRGENRTTKNLREFDDSRRTSAVDRDSYDESLVRSVSKSSSTPNIRSKPKVVLNRDADHEGEVLSRGDSERRSHARRSSRESVPNSERTHRKSSRGTIAEEEELGSSKRSKETHKLRDAAAGALAGGVLTAAALKHHDSQGEVSREKRRRRTKSRSSHSRSGSVAATDETPRRDVPPMPFASNLDSELTRDSLLSASTERPLSRSSRDAETPFETPLQEIPRAPLSDYRSSRTVTPERTPVTARNLGSNHSSRSFRNETTQSPYSDHSIANKAKIAALTAAGLGGIAMSHHADKEHNYNAEDVENTYEHQPVSPIESHSDVREGMRNPLIPEALRPRSQASLNAIERENYRPFVPSPLSSPGIKQYPTGQVAKSGKASFAERTRDSMPISDLVYGDETPKGEEMEDWFRQQHEENQRYRDSLTENSVRPSELSDLDNHRMSRYTEGSFGSANDYRDEPDKDLHAVGAQPQYVHTPLGVESAVASLLDPSMLSSSVRSSQVEPAKAGEAAYQERMAESVRDVNRPSPAPHEIEAAHDLETSPPPKSFWSAARDRAKALSDEAPSRERLIAGSPRQSDAESLRKESSFRKSTPIKMGASALPIEGDEMPEIGHGYDNESDVTTNPSDIQGPFGAKEGRQTFDEYSPRKNRRDFSFSKDDDAPIISSHHGHEDGALGVAPGAGAAFAAEHALSRKSRSSSLKHVPHRASVEEEYSDSRGVTPDLRHAEAVQVNKNATPINQPAAIGDEGYASEAYARSPGAETPRASVNGDREFTPQQLAEYEAAMAGNDDPFVNTKHSRHMSANSHGMSSPIYDSATGKGIETIESKDVVALMDHLTVRDAHRNARDTEILVTLVRSATEMRSYFEDMKRFIAEQDKMIMKNTDRDAEMTVNKVLSNTPKPQPASGARTPRASLDEEDLPTKRKNVFKRALRGLSKRGGNDLGRIEDMLMQLLDDVDVLKEQQGVGERLAPIEDDQSEGPSRRSSMDSYERMRAGVPFGQGSLARTSEGFDTQHAASLTPSKHVFHSGYDGRRGSINRVSTVMEGDEDEPLEPHERHVLDQEFDDEDRYGSPSIDARKNGVAFSGTPTQKTVPVGEKSPEASPEKHRKHKSTSSSLFGGIPKISRWSKTTTSSVPEGTDSRRQSQEQRPYSPAYRHSNDSLTREDAYDDDEYSLRSDDRRHSTQSMAREQEAAKKDAHMDTRSVRSSRSHLTRTPSPLIPDAASEVSRSTVNERAAAPSPRLMLPEDDEDFDDPKYQAHRNSLLLQHPQPRAGQTHRHQTKLESEAQDYHNEMGTDSDLSQRTADSDFDPLQWGSNPALSLARTQKLSNLSPINSPTRVNRRVKDDGPLVPSEPQSNNNNSINRKPAPPQPSFDRMYYSSPLGSGHLLEPIPEVRYSLETDRDVHRSPTLTPEPEPQVSRNRLSAGRKITGPRPMGSRSSSAQKDPASPRADVKRKPVGGRSQESIASETF